MKIPGPFLALSLIVSFQVPFADASDDSMKPFPAPQLAQQRYVIKLEAKIDEPRRQVELLVGKVIEVDCNRQRFMGDLTRETIDGWGYSYYEVKDISGPATTMMACPKASAKSEFVTLGGGPHFVRYNSKLPLVVYVPDGFEVRYRIWTAPEDMLPARTE